MNTPAVPPRRSAFLEGMHSGVPIALGYFAVAFSLGIVARAAGLTAAQGFLISFLNHASAGEYAGITAIAAGAPYWELAAGVLIANARYFLMSCALSQKLSPQTSLWHRLGVGFGVTDELFALAVGRPGTLEPGFSYGAMLVSIPSWACGTALGITAGNLLPTRMVGALGVALYGMFLAILIPAAKKDKVVAALVGLGFLLSFALSRLPAAAALSEGGRVIVLTLALAGAAAWLFPVKEGTYQ